MYRNESINVIISQMVFALGTHPPIHHLTNTNIISPRWDLNTKNKLENGAQSANTEVDWIIFIYYYCEQCITSESKTMKIHFIRLSKCVQCSFYARVTWLLASKSSIPCECHLQSSIFIQVNVLGVYFFFFSSHYSLYLPFVFWYYKTI